MAYIYELCAMIMTCNNSKYITLICPCCNISRYPEQYQKLKEFNEQHSYEHMISVIDSAKQGFLHWACDKCLEDKRAILGSPDIQNWGGFAYPYFAFYDDVKQCKTCGNKFIFSKEEQQHWFQVLKFIVWSEARNCKDCRKQERDSRTRNSKISKLVKNLSKNNIDQAERLIELYLEINNVDKAKFYFAILRKTFDSKKDNELKDRLDKIDRKIKGHILNQPQ